MSQKTLLFVQLFVLCCFEFLSGALSLAETSSTRHRIFDLERQKEFICKFSYIEGKRDEENTLCYPITERIPERIEVVEAVRYMQKMKEESPSKEIDLKSLSSEELTQVGGVVRLRSEDLEEVKDHYRRISIRNLAIDARGSIEERGEVKFPFFVEIYWQGEAQMEGSLYGEGIFYVPLAALQLNKSIAEQMLDFSSSVKAEFNEFSDSRTEENKNYLRFLVTSARAVHFTAINGTSTNVDQDTLDFLNRIIGPVLIGELFDIPTYKFFQFPRKILQ
ncbi:MAG: hypothetical protein KDD35_04815 [Bdellovibrionales bacterium]|nr:hypothetical protein [Bdellovibrionales bacterium]